MFHVEQNNFNMKQVIGNLVDIHSRSIYPAKIKIENGIIVAIDRVEGKKFDTYIIPGFVDSHVHIESSMLTPQEFSKLVVPRGTVAIVTDPHEIANVTGVNGILAMVKNSATALCKMFFTIPSCVPATSLDGSGAVVGSFDVEILAKSGNFVALSEVMDLFAVINGDKEMLLKLQSAKRNGLKIDGHAPLCSGENLKKYVLAGVSTDHECVNLDEASEKISAGMKIQIRYGSAVNNYNDLKELIKLYPESVMFCTDDSHPDMLLRLGHVDKMVRQAVKDGYDIFDVLKAASLNPINHYNLSVGTLRVSEQADFQVVKSLKTFKTIQTFVAGKCVYSEDDYSVENDEGSVVNISLNKFKRSAILPDEIKNPLSPGEYKAIQIVPNQLITDHYNFTIHDHNDNFESDIDSDLLKLVYINRYNEDSKPQIAYVRGFGFKKGAIASTVAHDSHNILAVGTNDKDLLKAINKLVEYKGGLVSCCDGKVTLLPLPIGGIMSDRSGLYVDKIFTTLKRKVKNYGSVLNDPFMTLSFLSLIVIPKIKLGEQGLFDFETFSFLNIQDRS